METINNIKTQLSLVSDRLEKDPEDTELLIRKADLLRNLGFQIGDRKYAQESLEIISRVVEKNPNDNNARIEKGITHYTLDQQNYAISEYTKSISISPTSRAYYNRGVSKWRKIEISNDVNHLNLQAKKEAEEVLDDYEAALEISPRLVNAIYNKGVVLMKLDRYKEAIEMFNAVTGIEPSKLDARFNLGICFENLVSPRYSNISNLNRAISEYSKVISKDASYLSAFFNRALCYEYSGEKGRYSNHKYLEKSIADYSKILEVEPQNSHVLNNRGWALQHLGRVKEAIEDFEKVIKFSNDGFLVGQLKVHIENLRSAH